MIKTTSNKFIMILYYILSTLLLEVVTFRILELGVFPEYFWYDFAVVIFFAILIFAIPNYTAQFIVSAILLLGQIVLIYLNYSLYVIYGDIFSFDMFNLIKEAGTAVTSSFIYFRVVFQLVALAIILGIVGIMLLKQVNKSKVKKKQHFTIFIVILMIFMQCFSYTYFVSSRNKINSIGKVNIEEYVNSDSFLMNTLFLKARSYRKFGTYGYYMNIVLNNITPEDEVLSQMAIDYFNDGEMYTGSTYSDGSSVFGCDKGKNVIVVMMESAEWFGFTNCLYDYDLNNLVVDNISTPNIYSIMFGENEGTSDDAVYSTNFFAKSKTNFSEAYSILGNHPVAKNLSDVAGKSFKKSSNAFGYSLPNVLKSAGYYTTYVHSNEISFYDRNLTHGNMGFEHVYGKNNIKDGEGKQIYTGDELEWNNWDCEGKFAEKAIEYIVPVDQLEAGQPFYTFYLNVSSHGPYDEKSNTKDGDAVKYYDYYKYGEGNCDIDQNGNYKVKSGVTEKSAWYNNVMDAYQKEDLVEQLLYYQCGIKGLDDAIGVIKEKLVDEGIYDDTVVVLYSDHYAYYDNLAYYIKDIPVEDQTAKTQLFEIPFILSSPGIKAYNAESHIVDGQELDFLVTDRFCSAYDIIPTLFDLLGISFNKNLYLGNSLFAPMQHSYQYINDNWSDITVYYSNTGGLFSKDVYTYDMDRFVLQIDSALLKDPDDMLSRFKSEATSILVKINYINVLNNYRLYGQLDPAKTININNE